MSTWTGSFQVPGDQGRSPDYQGFQFLFVICVTMSNIRSLQQRFAGQDRLTQTMKGIFSSRGLPGQSCRFQLRFDLVERRPLWARVCVCVRDCSLSVFILAGSPSPQNSDDSAGMKIKLVVKL